MALDFEKAVLGFMGVLIVGGIGFIVWENGVAEELRAGLGTAEAQLAEIGELAMEIDELKREMAEDTIASGKLGNFAYIEKQAVESRIGKTSFNIAPPTNEDHPSEGYRDTRFLLTPALHGAAQGKDDFTRQEIANFLLYIEGNTTRMKVTRLRLDLSNRAGAGKDAWKPSFTLTDRHPLPPKS